MSPRASCSTPQLVRRANAYQLLSRSLTDPDRWEPSLPGSFPERFQEMSDPLPPLADAVADAMRAGLKDKEHLRVAYAKLFLGPFRIEASPYASLYLDPERQLMGAESMAVAESYAEAGLGPGPGPREAPDHITQELEFMYFLGFQAIRTEQPIWQRRAARFWTKHLGPWLPAFGGQITAAGLHPCYDALGRLLLEFAGAEAAHFDRQS